MNSGLGFNTPISLRLGRDNYEALIERHGQYVRWRSSARCACVNSTNRQPNARCPICSGNGIIYGYQKKEDRTEELPIGKDYFVELTDRTGETINGVYLKGNKIEHEQFGRFIKPGSNQVSTDEYVTIHSTISSEKKITVAELIDVGGGYFRVSGCRVGTPRIETIVHDSPGDVLSVKKVSDGVKDFEILEYRMDMIRLKLTKPAEPEEEGGEKPEGEIPILIEGTLFATDIVWIEPSKFFILSQGFNEVDSKMVEAVGGDAVLTAPYSCDIGEGDVITVLSGSSIAKEVITRGKGDLSEDMINAFFVESIERIFTTIKEYNQGIDYILTGTNKIHWLTLDAPKEGESYSLVYKYLPTYTIIRTLPSLRTSENQRMPRRAVLKLFAAYKEGKRVNQND